MGQGCSKETGNVKGNGNPPSRGRSPQRRIFVRWRVIVAPLCQRSVEDRRLAQPPLQHEEISQWLRPQIMTRDEKDSFTDRGLPI